jgi:Schlafen, AlbA_2
MELQELVARARLLFEGAEKRRRVFELINGKRSAKEIARMSGKKLSGTLHDLQKMRDMELITQRLDANGSIVKRDNSIVYERAPLLKHLSSSYFKEPERLVRKKPQGESRRPKTRVMSAVSTPSIKETLDICNSGEDQLYEFKAAGTSADKLAKEICAFANTKMGGIIFYGVEDDGSIAGSDMTKQRFDQMLQNSIKHNVTATPAIKLVSQDILGYNIILIIVPPWNKGAVHHFQDGVYIRRGTNVFKTKADETRKLHDGEYVI